MKERKRERRGRERQLLGGVFFVWIPTYVMYAVNVTLNVVSSFDHYSIDKKREGNLHSL